MQRALSAIAREKGWGDIRDFAYLSEGEDEYERTKRLLKKLYPQKFLYEEENVYSISNATMSASHAPSRKNFGGDSVLGGPENEHALIEED